MITASVTLSPKKAFGVGFELAEDHGADFFWAVFFVAHLDLHAIAAFDDFVAHQLDVALNFFVIKVAANQTLNFINRILGVGHLLAAGHLPDQPLAILIDCYNRRRRAVTF